MSSARNRIILVLFFTPMLTNCGPSFNGVNDGTNQILKEHETLVGDMIVNKHDVATGEDELSDLEGDTLETQAKGETLSTAGVAVKDTSLWTDGILRYKFAKNVTAEMKKEFRRQCRLLGKKANVTCLPKRANDVDFVKIKAIKSDTYCGLAHLGKVGGQQSLQVAKSCWFDKVTLKHELMHAFSVAHEMSHPARDKYIDINEDNMDFACADVNFVKLKRTKVHKQTGFDYKSIMMYHSWACSKNGQPTITIKGKTGDDAVFYSNTKMSAKDHNILVKLYGEAL